MYPPHAVIRPVMFQSWTLLTFLHWRYPADVIQRHLPPGLHVDEFDGSAWIGVAPFLITRLRAPIIPALPWISSFPETNVRTYVRRHHGEPGIWFFTLEAARLAAVLGARALFGLPYHWARMKVETEDHLVRYSSRRHGFAGAASSIEIEPGDALIPSPLEVFLTARFRLYSIFRGKLACADVEHEPWPLQRARAKRLDQTLIASVGLPASRGDVLVHYSPGVEVRVGGIHRVQEMRE